MSTSNHSIKPYNIFKTLIFLFLFTSIAAQENALSFELEDYIEISPNPLAGLTEFTITGWATIDEGNVEDFIFSGRYPNNNNLLSMSFWNPTTGTALRIRVRGDGDAIEPHGIIKGVPFHYALTYKDTVVNVYVNGVNIYSRDNYSNQYSAGTTFWLGKTFSASAEGKFTGIQDEISLWSTELDSNDVYVIFSCGVEAVEDISDLVAYYTFNQGSAGEDNTEIITLVDQIGGNDGALVNFDLSGTTSNWVSFVIPDSLCSQDYCIGEVCYATAQEAVDAAQDGDTVTIVDPDGLPLLSINDKMITIMYAGQIPLDGTISLGGFDLSDAQLSIGHVWLADPVVTISYDSVKMDNSELTLNAIGEYLTCCGPPVQNCCYDLTTIFDIQSNNDNTINNLTGSAISTGPIIISDNTNLTLMGAAFRAENVIFEEGTIALGTVLYATGPSNSGPQFLIGSGGTGSGFVDCPTCPPLEDGEPIPGVNISLEQVPGGAVWTVPDGTGDCPTCPPLEDGEPIPGVNISLGQISIVYIPNQTTTSGGIVSAPVLLTDIGQDPQGINPQTVVSYVVPDHLKPPVLGLARTYVGDFDETLPPPHSYSEVVSVVAILDDAHTPREFSVATMDIGVPTSSMIVDDEHVNSSDDFGVVVAANITSGGVDYYLGELTTDVTLVAGEQVSSPGDNLVRITEVTPGSPFVILGCPECGNNKVKICHVPPGNPSNSTTKCVSKSSLLAHLENGSYCGPCAEFEGLQFVNPIIPAVSNEKLQVYPNPTNDLLTISFETSPKSSWSALLIDMNGRTVQSYEGEKGERSTQINTKMLTPGIYMLNVVSDKGNTQVKVVIQL